MSRKEKLVYLAGIVDGEGTIDIAHSGYGKNAYTVRLLVVNTNKSLMEWLVNNFRGSVYQRKKYFSWKISYVWRISGKKATSLINEIFPYLIIKRNQALVAFCFDVARENASWVSLGFGKGRTFSTDTLEAIKLCIEEVKFWNKKGEEGQLGKSPMEIIADAA